MTLLKYLLKGAAAILVTSLVLFPIILVACSLWFLLPWTWRHE